MMKLVDFNLYESSCFLTPAKEATLLTENSPRNVWTVFLLTCRPPETDFRLPLGEALASLGHDVHYIFINRRPKICNLSDPENGPRYATIFDVVRTMRKSIRGNPHAIVINSTNLVYPILSSALRKVTGGLWCFDLHDHLLYEKTGLARIRARVAQAVLARNSDFMVHAAPALSEIFPHSVHLGNASSVNRVDRQKFVANNVLIIASLDGRFDFDLLNSVAYLNPSISFDLYGHVSVHSIKSHLRTSLLYHSNITYHGSYNNSDIQNLLAKYSIMFAPYKVSSRLTKYIDPLRFYHCLNSGIEVVTTDIPAGLALEGYLHILRHHSEFGPLIDRLSRMPALRKNISNVHKIFDWTEKARNLITIAEAQQIVRSKRDA